MAKRPGDRYPSASALQTDLEAFLAQRVPSIVGPDTPWQPLTLWARRNALPVSIASAAIIGLATLSGVALVQRAEAERQRDRATAEAARADERAEAAERAEKEAAAARDAEKQRADQLKKVSDFQSQMLAQIDTTTAGVELMKDVRERFVAASDKAGVGEEERTARLDALRQELVRVNATDTAASMIDRTILRPAIKAIDEQFRDDPATDASLREAMADLYVRIGLYDLAFPLQESALATRRRVLGEDHSETLVSINNMGTLLSDQGKRSEAELYLRDALKKRRRVLGEEHQETLTSINNIGVLLWLQGKLAEAEPYSREALENRRRAGRGR